MSWNPLNFSFKSTYKQWSSSSSSSLHLHLSVCFFHVFLLIPPWSSGPFPPLLWQLPNTKEVKKKKKLNSLFFVCGLTKFLQDLTCRTGWFSTRLASDSLTVLKYVLLLLKWMFLLMVLLSFIWELKRRHHKDWWRQYKRLSLHISFTLSDTN